VKSLPRLLTLAVLTIGCVGCDQTTKSLAQAALSSRDPLALWPGFLRLTYAENPGAFLSIGSGLPPELRVWLFVGLAGLALVALLTVSLRQRALRWPQVVALGLLVAGGCGNLVDRVSLGVVRDFLQLGVGPLQTGVFNLADAAITLGSLLLAASACRRASAEPRHDRL
jgi:signal peptidase II